MKIYFEKRNNKENGSWEKAKRKKIRKTKSKTEIKRKILVNKKNQRM